jgi:DNA ligase-1
MPIERPMLASTADTIEDIALPCLATPKVDGIRCLRVGSYALSRSFKRIRNDHIRGIVEQLPEGLDGELVAGVGTDFQLTTSAVMRNSGTPSFRYLVFDWFVEGDQLAATPYERRIKRLLEVPSPAEILYPKLCATREELQAYYNDMLLAGYEGLITRTPDSPYHFGRARPRTQWMMKLKQFLDSEMVVQEFKEQRQNGNPATTNNFGYMRRPGGKQHHVPKGTLGSLIGVDVHTGVRVQVGSGLDDELRQTIWNNRPAYVGRIVKYRYQPTGVKDKPRFPTFLSFRDSDDMDPGTPPPSSSEDDNVLESA